MFPGQQGANARSDWMRRLGIKLLEGAPSTEKWRPMLFLDGIKKIDALSPGFAQWTERDQTSQH